MMYSSRKRRGSHIGQVLPLRSHLLCAWLLTFTAVLAFPSPSHAELEQLNGEAAVEAAAEGLRREASFPWYDAEKDELRPLQLREKAKPKEAKEWAAQPPKRKTPRRRWNWNGNWNFLSGLSLFMQVAVYGFLIALVLLAIYFLVNSEAVQGFFRSTEPEDEGEDTVTDEQRMENLPFDVRRPRSDLLSEAKRMYDLGRYGDAIVYLFSYQLLQLDKNQWIRLAKGKTNRQYLNEVRRRRDLRGILAKTMVPFEDFFFGHYQIERERFESCWDQMDEFHRLVKAEAAS